MAREAVIRAVRPVQIHADLYYDIAYSFASDPDAVHQSRLAADNAYADPQPGDEVLVDSVLSMVTAVRRKE